MIIDGLIDFIRCSPEKAAEMISHACYHNKIDISERCATCRYRTTEGDRTACDLEKIQRDIKEDVMSLSVKWGQDVTK